MSSGTMVNDNAPALPISDDNLVPLSNINEFYEDGAGARAWKFELWFSIRFFKLCISVETSKFKGISTSSADSTIVDNGSVSEIFSLRDD
jgi:hypothetical protein